MDQIIDALLNSYEHWGDLGEEAMLLSLDLVREPEEQEQLKSQLVRLFQAWLDNEDNLRMEISLKYHENPAQYNQLLRDWIKQYIKISL